MSAGLSKEQLYSRTYTRLNRIRRDLFEAGYKTTYSKGALLNDEGQRVVYFKILRASNGEVFGQLVNNTGRELK